MTRMKAIEAHHKRVIAEMQYQVLYLDGKRPEKIIVEDPDGKAHELEEWFFKHLHQPWNPDATKWIPTYIEKGNAIPVHGSTDLIGQIWVTWTRGDSHQRV